MKLAELKAALEDPALQQPAKMKKLVDRTLAEGRETGQGAIALWHQGYDTTAANAQKVMSQIEELALDALLNAPDSIDVTKLVWLMRTLTDIEVEMRKRVILKLMPLLDRKLPVPPLPVFEEIEEPIPEVRVCDEAYMLLRRLVETSEPAESYFLNIRTFGNLDEPERDAEIEKARKENRFTKWDQLD